MINTISLLFSRLISQSLKIDESAHKPYLTRAMLIQPVDLLVDKYLNLTNNNSLLHLLLFKFI